MIAEIITIMGQNKGCSIKHYHRENKAYLVISGLPDMLIKPESINKIIACCYEDTFYNFDYERYFLRDDAMDIYSLFNNHN